MPACLVGQRSSILLRVAKFYILVAPIGLERDATNVKVVGSNPTKDAKFYGYGTRDVQGSSKPSYAGSNPATRAKF
jgi:hypothetical protein